MAGGREEGGREGGREQEGRKTLTQPKQKSCYNIGPGLCSNSFSFPTCSMSNCYYYIPSKTLLSRYFSDLNSQILIPLAHNFMLVF